MAIALLLTALDAPLKIEFVHFHDTKWFCMFKISSGVEVLRQLHHSAPI